MKQTILLLLFTVSIQAQKYVIVPYKYPFSDRSNQYNLNKTTKLFFEKEGFDVLYDNERLPDEIVKNRCSAYYISVEKKSKLFTQYMTVFVKDCYTETVLQSEQGKSRLKEYNRSYNQALRNALKSISGKLTKSNKVVLEQKEQKSNELVGVAVKSSITSGYQFSKGFTKLVDKNGDTFMSLTQTSIQNVYLANKSGIRGVLVKTGSTWLFEYEFDGKLKSEKIEIQ